MSIQFEEDNQKYYGRVHSPRTGSKLGNFLIKIGVAKNATSANVILMIGALLIFGLSIYVFAFGLKTPQPKHVVPAKTPAPLKVAK